MKSILLTFFLLATNLLFGQATITGIVKQPDGLTLSYVNIGIKQKNIGTVSDSKGRCNLKIAAENLKDTLTFSYVSSTELNIPIQTILSSSLKEFVLNNREKELREVIITNKKVKTLNIGIRSFTPFLFCPQLKIKQKI